MRGWLCVNLGTWHVYKQANSVIWKHWAGRVFAPLFYDLIPDANFNKNATLTTIVTFLTYVRLAYPSFRQQLEDTLCRMRVVDADPIGVSQLRDLKRLLEFFIPVVSHTIFIINNENDAAFISSDCVGI